MIADDHPFYRGRLAISLRDRGLTVVAEVANGEAAIEAVERDEPDVIVMDLRMPIVSGVDAIRRMVAVAPGRRVVAITASAMEDEIADAILCGASAFVAKDRPVSELVAAIDEAVAGRPLLSPGTMQVLRRRVRGIAEPGRNLAGAPLVRRELELLDRLAKSGYPTGSEGASGVSVDDVEAILLKLRIEHRVQEALMADELETGTGRDDPKGELEG